VKPIPILEEHKKILTQLSDRAEGITTGLVIANGNLNAIINRISEDRKELLSLKNKYDTKSAELAERDCDKHIAIFTQNFNQTWGWMPWNWQPVVNVDKILKCDMTRVVVSQGYFADNSVTKKHLQGTIYNSFFQTLSTTITAFASYKEYYFEDIKKLKDELQFLEGAIATKENKSKVYLHEQSQASEMISRYETIINGIEKEKEAVKGEFFSKEEILALLKKYNV